MSYDFIVYAKNDRLPDPDRLSRSLAASAVVLSSGDLRTSSGYVRAAMNGRDTGFSLRIDRITPDEIADYRADLASSGEKDQGFLAALTGSDTRLTFQCANNDEINAARIVADSVGTLSDAWISDPQTGRLEDCQKVALDDALARELDWTKSDDVDHPWETVVDGRLWRVRLGDYPAEVFYTLLIDGREIGGFDRWPRNWTRPEEQRGPKR